MIKGMGSYILSAVLGVGGAAAAGSYGAVNYFNNRNIQVKGEIEIKSSTISLNEKGVTPSVNDLSGISKENNEHLSSQTPRTEESLGNESDLNSVGIQPRDNVLGTENLDRSVSDNDSVIPEDKQLEGEGSLAGETQEKTNLFGKFIYNGKDQSSHCEELIIGVDKQPSKRDLQHQECSEIYKKAKEMWSYGYEPKKWLKTNQESFSDSVKVFLLPIEEKRNDLSYEKLSNGWNIEDSNCIVSSGDFDGEIIVSCYESVLETEEDNNTGEIVDFSEDDQEFGEPQAQEREDSE
ncbi:hypothetical protein [Mycoplasma suis]|uniref:Uncharacterized protein n=1 Tax=Mycoplasma suis (strain Illinois) TaxID=768700 RepID=F0QQK9_MYCSL|nr:hypothetical protein [Mycoplasma suis]ADX97779.1 hypothetical protein MSU_0235 [Mycoplasma suis str. Illinois]